MFGAPLKVAALMRRFEPDWFVAGGWAIDLFVGRETRLHEDIEIAVFRPDQTALHNYLDGWLLKKALNGALADWKRDEFLELPTFEIHCFNDKDETCQLRSLEVLFNDTNGDDWIFRRNPKITKPLSELRLTHDSGIKFLRPEVVLLYKSKNPRPKDERDFQTAARLLDAASKDWLKNAISVCYSQHHWLEGL